MVDHRAGDGLPRELSPTGTPIPGGSMLESAVILCNHCQAGVILNPNRSRSRGYCPKCDRYVCDQCEAARVASGGECVPFDKIIDTVLELGSRNLPIPDNLIPRVKDSSNG